MPFPSIAILLPRFGRYGGVEQFGYRLAESLGTRGYPVDFICARQEIEAPAGVTVLRTGRPFGPRWLKMLVFAAKAESLRRKKKYACTISLGKTLGQNIMRVGGGPLPEFWELSEKSYPEGLARSIKRLERRMSLANILTRWMENRQYRSTERIVAVSHFVRDRILKANPDTDPNRIKVIYNRPDLTRFSPPVPEERRAVREQFGISPESVAIGLATSNFQLKGTAPLIKSLTLLPEECVLLIAGGRNYGKYMDLADKLGVATRVQFLGKVAAMPEWYKAIDVFALPSFYDACSNAVLEALASGLPTMSTTANGSSYFLPPENIVDDPGNPEALAQVLLPLIATARENAVKGTRPAFVWPETLASGLDDFITVIEDYLRAKTFTAKPETV